MHDSIVAAVRRRGGIARTRDLLAAGFSKHHQASAVARGGLVRIARSHVAVADADPWLMAAARGGVILTCITQAARLGLWVLEEAAPHVAAVGRRVGVSGAHVHWSRPVVPRHPSSLEDPLENVLAIVASCAPREQALAIWESALNTGLVTLEALRRLPLGPAGRALCDVATPWADSGLETLVVDRLRWLRLPLRTQAWLLGRRVDVLVGERLVIQADGGHHVGAQREADIAHDAALMLAGYHVIRVGYGQIVHRWPEVQDLIMRAVAQGLHLAR